MWLPPSCDTVQVYVSSLREVSLRRFPCAQARLPIVELRVAIRAMGFAFAHGLCRNPPLRASAPDESPLGRWSRVGRFPHAGGAEAGEQLGDGGDLGGDCDVGEAQCGPGVVGKKVDPADVYG